MDITIEVMLPPRGALDFSLPMHGRYRMLAPVAVYSLKATPVVGMQRTGYIHVTDVPVAPRGSEERALQHLNRVLCEQWENPDRTVRERRKWVGISVRLSSRAATELLEQRQVVMPWTQFRALMNHQVEIRTLTNEDVA